MQKYLEPITINHVYIILLSKVDKKINRKILFRIIIL